jgi:nitrate/nitrite transport system permease protein
MSSKPLRLVETPLVQTHAGPLPEAVAAPLSARPSVSSQENQDIIKTPNKYLDFLNHIGATIVPTLIMLILFLGFWQIAAGGKDSSFPSPAKVWSESHDVIMHPLKGVSYTSATGLTVKDTGDVGLLVHISKSLSRVVIGYSLSAVAGICLGVLIGQSPIAYRALDPLFQILRTVPPLAWLPISLAIFQQAQPSAIFLIFITAIWPIILNTAAGVQAIPVTYKNVAKVLQLNGLQYFFKILLPATVPYMFTGLRIGVGMSWLAIVAAEMVQGGTGVGFFIWDSYNSGLITDTIVALVFIGLVGFTLDKLVAWVGRLIARQG